MEGGSDHNPNSSSNSLEVYRIGRGSDLNPWEVGSAECGRGFQPTLGGP